MKKSLATLATIMVGAMFASGALAHDQSYSANANASVSGNNSNYAGTRAEGNGSSTSVSGSNTGGFATAGATVGTLPGFNSGAGTGTTAGAIVGATGVTTSGFARNTSEGNGTGNAGSQGNVRADAASGYNSFNNYVPLTVSQGGSASSSAGHVVSVGPNTQASVDAGSINGYAGAGFATRIVVESNVAPFVFTAGNVADVKTSSSWANQAISVNPIDAFLQNASGSEVRANGCFRVAKTGDTGGC